MSDCCVCALRSCRTCLSLLTGTWNAWLRCSPTNVTHRVLRQRFFMLFRTSYWRDVKTVNFFETSFTVQFLRQRLGVFSPRFGFFSPRWSVLYITTEKEGFPALASRDVLRACLVVTAFFFFLLRTRSRQTFFVEPADAVYQRSIALRSFAKWVQSTL